MILLALIISCLAAGSLYASWRSKQIELLNWIGWLLAFSSVYFWSIALGPEFGTVYALLIFTCVIWILVWRNRQEAKRVNDARPVWHQLTRPSVVQVARNSALFVLAVPVTGLVSLMLSLVLVWFFPWTMLNKVTTAIFIMPLIWGGFSAWIIADSRLWLTALSSLGLLILLCLLVFILL